MQDTRLVWLVPRVLVWPTARNQQRRAEVIEDLAQRYEQARTTHRGRTLKIPFPDAPRGRASKDDVMATLDEIEPQWRRFFVLYPTEGALRRFQRQD